jgi:osmoprotectant transport system ATP-binding protein
MASSPLLDLIGLRKALGGRVVLDDIHLSIAAGTLVALVGPSGSGKTTLLKAINRLVVPDAGQVLIDGADTADMPVAALRRRIGYVIQGIGLFPHMTVAQNIAIVPRLNGAPAAETDDRVAGLLRLMALPADMADRYPRALSGGQAQRIGVARALAAKPAIMLMDEPFGALDPITRADLGAAYRRLHDDLGLTTIMVTHDMAEALLIADRIVVLHEGRILADAAPADLIAGHKDPRVAELIDVPRRQAEALARLAAPR